MADFDTAARQEAERRYPDKSVLFGGETVDDLRVAAFEAGARWGASPLNTATLRATFARAERAEAVLAEVAALADDMSDELDMLRAESGPVALSYANCTAMDLRRLRAVIARAHHLGGGSDD